ncbi:hypothetical protein KJ707_02645 [Patescibacteria group bacterium]|nr:hypothetical protein [Patescibacteria group bacterium]MBU1966786.1 hypothetical protein [Patescibacteria group bacterium]MBU2543436.1 hypothetical protein [Patescibacteria group bacterium]
MNEKRESQLEARAGDGTVVLNGEKFYPCSLGKVCQGNGKTDILGGKCSACQAWWREKKDRFRTD